MIDSPSSRYRSLDAQREKRHPSSTRPPMRLTWHVRTSKWKPSMTHTGTKCICFAEPALRAQIDVSTSFFTVFAPHLNFTSTRDSSFKWLFCFYCFSPCIFFCSSLPANVRQNVAKRKHISLYHSTLHLQAHQTSGWEWKSLRKASNDIEFMPSFFFLLPFKLSHIDFHISRRLPSLW